MFRQNFSNHEKLLIQEYSLAGIAGHKTDKGDSRELFVKSFLRNHLPSNVEIGRGEVFGWGSVPGEDAHQIDLVVYDRSFPKIDMGGVSAYLVEGVSAVIEVKSVLNEAAIKQATNMARDLKKLQLAKCDGRNHYMHCSLIGYTCDTKDMQTLVDRVCRVEESVGINEASHEFPDNDYDAPGLDSVVALGVGIAHARNSRCGLNPQQPSKYRWLYSSTEDANLQLWFLQLFAACSGANGLDYLKYIRDQSVYAPIGVKQ